MNVEGQCIPYIGSIGLFGGYLGYLVVVCIIVERGQLETKAYLYIVWALIVYFQRLSFMALFYLVVIHCSQHF